MKTTPEEATRRALSVRLDGVKATVRQRTHKSNGLKDTVLVVAFTLECEGRRSTGRVVESRQNFFIDSLGLKVPVRGAKRDWTDWAAPTGRVRAAVLTAVYGTTNVKNDPASNTARHIESCTQKMQKSVTLRVRKAMATKKVTETLSKADRAVRRQEVVTLIGELLRRHPGMRKQDFLSAFEEAKRAQIVREVMES